MRFCSLGSGSRGNAYLVEKADTTLLVECGFPPKTLKKRLAARYVAVEEISAALISHEHGDHVAGIKFLEQHSIPVYTSAGTARALGQLPNWHCVSAGEAFSLGGLTVEPFPIPHDVTEPMQFIIDDGTRRLAIVTDLGYVPPAVRRACAEVDALVVECNYDEEMLRNNPNYPQQIKDRISGDYGHLSNAAAAELVAQTKGGKRRQIIAAHLSEKNNTPELARQAIAAADGGAAIHIAGQSAGTDWIQI